MNNDLTVLRAAITQLGATFTEAHDTDIDVEWDAGETHEYTMRSGGTLKSPFVTYNLKAIGAATLVVVGTVRFAFDADGWCLGFVAEGPDDYERSWHPSQRFWRENRPFGMPDGAVERIS